MQVEAFSSGAAEGRAASAPSPRLVRAAHEFEGQMLQELLRPMTGSGLGEDEDSAGSGGALGQFAAEALGQALSAQGGFGIANRIVHDLSHSGKPTDAGKVTGNLHRDTVLRRSE